jgi:hypothetical protein
MNIGDPYVPVRVADVDLPQTVTFVGGRRKDFEAKAARGGFSVVWIAAVNS